jgi:hypothetical protein
VSLLSLLSQHPQAIQELIAAFGDYFTAGILLPALLALVRAAVHAYFVGNAVIMYVCVCVLFIVSKCDRGPFSLVASSTLSSPRSVRTEAFYVFFCSLRCIPRDNAGSALVLVMSATRRSVGVLLRSPFVSHLRLVVAS